MMQPAPGASGKLEVVGMTKLISMRLGRTEEQAAKLSKAQMDSLMDKHHAFRDFRSNVSALADLVERAGHIAIFTPKFHPEVRL